MRAVVDTGGTFTDLVIEGESAGPRVFKVPTTPENPILGILEVFEVAARGLGMSREALLAQLETFVHATTRATNAILTESVAQTAFLTTEGHPDILVFREGGRTEPFNFTRWYPEPYVPRALTFEVPERIGSDGEIVRRLDEEALENIVAALRAAQVEAVGVCLLWSIVNPIHELRIGELLKRELPGTPYTLSHALNPSIREYRRASSTVIDASLKPLMASYLADVEKALRDAGFAGRLLTVTATGGVLDALTVAGAPIHSIGSGPAMAPVAGRYFARIDVSADTAIVADAGGTSYDVSLVRGGRIPTTRETWLGPIYAGHITGFPSVDVKSIGAGGGSIARVDEGGLLQVGPESAGAVPGPACYGRGGTRPTVTDASLVLGYLDPEYFLGGAMPLDQAAARTSIERDVAKPLGLDVLEAASAVVSLATEHMVRAIEEITLNQGIDPRAAVTVAGGGAAGLNAVMIARRLDVPYVVIPELAGALSALGGSLSDLTADFSATLVTSSTEFDFVGVNAALEGLTNQARAFIAGPGQEAPDATIEFSAEARYPQQVWELEVTLRSPHFESRTDVERVRQDFHRMHESVFAISDDESPIEIVTWRARARCPLKRVEEDAPGGRLERAQVSESREVYFDGEGLLGADIVRFEHIALDTPIEGPAVIESPVTTVIIPPDSSARRVASGSLIITPWAAKERRQRMRRTAISG